MGLLVDRETRWTGPAVRKEKGGVRRVGCQGGVIIINASGQVLGKMVKIPKNRRQDASHWKEGEENLIN